MIEKAIRTFSEKNTSVETDIEVSQKGIIAFAPTSSNIIGIPTTIDNPVILHLQPLSSITMAALQSWYCDLKLYQAASVFTAFASLASASTDEEIGARLRMDASTKSLFVARKSLTTSEVLDNKLSDTTLWKKDDRFLNNAKKYLKVVANAGSASLKTKKQFLAYEVRGYNNS